MTQAPIYIFSGTESFLMEEAAQRIAESFPDYSTETLATADISRWIQEISSPSLFAEKRLIIVQSTPFLSQAISDAEFDMLKSVVKGLSPDIKSILLHNKALDKRKKISKWASKEPSIHMQEFSGFKEWEGDKAATWLQGAAKNLGLKLTKPLASELVERCGLSPAILYQRLLSLRSFMGTRSEITIEDISTMVHHDYASAHQFSQALKTRNFPQLLSAAKQLTSSGDDPIQLLGLIYSNLRFFLDMLILRQNGESEAGIAKALGRHPFFIKQSLGEITGHYSPDFLSQIIPTLATLDYDCKTGQCSPDAALTQVLIALKK